MVFTHMFKIVIFALSIFTVMGCQTGIAGGFSYGTDKTVVGCMRHHTIAPKETLLGIARNFGLGFNEIQLLYPEMDPWVPDIALTSRPDGSEPLQHIIPILPVISQGRPQGFTHKG